MTISYGLLLLALLGTFTSTIFFFLVLVAVVRHRRHRSAPREEGPGPPVSVLKPLCGMEPRLRESLESCFRQEYPEFELVFGARNDADPALEVARQLGREYPKVKVQVVLSGEPPWANAKVWSLSKMLPAAKHELLVIADSDVIVAPGYLRAVTAPLHDPKVGMVTCLYRGLPAGGLWSRLEALGMSVEMTSGVLVANLLEGMKFALGPTMALRRKQLEEVGGIATLAEYCSDDFLLGNWIAERGYKVVLSEEVIDHVVLNRSLRDSVAHQVRWMKSTRYSRPQGHFWSVLTYAMPFGVLGLAAGMGAGRPLLGAALLAWAALSLALQSVIVGWGAVRDARAASFAWLYPLRGLMGGFFWAASYTGNVIKWRNEYYRMSFGGKMTRVEDGEKKPLVAGR